IEAAQGLNITFHRAFDMCRNPSEALEAIIDLGCNRILTSGGCNNAYNGRFNLKELVLQAAGRVIIMPGCGITPDNIK
ncbi:copper homeostasis protein CutC, partial [Salmonella enterica]|uniref:copper homeostasis protein CutC n=1 Tax=Salmonella enterica TaxID=28901 RepID=UPI0026651545